jgi:hypothetical protein
MIKDSYDVWGIDFDIYPNFEVTEKAKKVFEKEIQKYFWTLKQSGILRGQKSKAILKYFIVDLENPETIKAFNLIPAIFKREVTPDERGDWSLRVYDKDDPEYIDYLCIDHDGSLFFSEYAKFAKQTEDLDADLARAIKEIEKELS